MDFNLSTSFNSFDADKEFNIDIENIDEKLETVTNVLANNPLNINYDSELLDDLIELVQGYRLLESKHQKQISYLITSSLNYVAQIATNSQDQGESVEMIKTTLEKYGYLLFVLLTYWGKEDHNVVASGTGRNKTGPQANAKWKENCAQVEEALCTINSVFQVNLSSVFVTTPEKSLFIDIFIRPIFHLMESHERVKVSSIKTIMFKIIALSVKYHGHGELVQSSILQCLTYYTHLPNYMAELLHTLGTEFDYGVVTEEVLREISQIEFNSNDTNGPKSISQFLIRLSEISPRLILKQMSCIAQLLDNSNQTLRCSVVEACGNVAVDIIKQDYALNENQSEEMTNKSYNDQHVEGLLELLEERFLDQNPYVRTKAIQAFIKIINLPVKLSLKRQKIMILAVRSLDDRSTLVRRNAIKLMSKLLLTQPFAAVHGTQLKLEIWKERFSSALSDFEKLAEKVPNVIQEHGSDDEDEDEDENLKENDMDIDAENNDVLNDSLLNGDHDSDKSDNEDVNLPKAVNDESVPDEELPNSTEIAKAKLTVEYYRNAVNFIKTVEKGTDIVSRLLYSKNRNEVLECMDFLVLAHAYDISNAKEGIRRMLHLVWMKGSSDEGKSIAAHLIDCYRDVFLVAPPDLSFKEQSAFIAKNLIELTRSASASDLASLEKLLSMMYEERFINQEVIQTLWQIYSFVSSPNINEDDMEKVQERALGSIILLSMFALADRTIMLKGFDLLLSVGLGDAGKQNLQIAKYTCIALQRIIPNLLKSKMDNNFKITREGEAIEQLCSVLLNFNRNPDWYSVAEAALNAIYKISSHPDVVCSDIIKKKTEAVFSDISDETSIISLSQLLFIVGHVAIKTIVHLEKMEAQFKKRKHDSESSGNADKAESNEESNDNELEMIGGTSEDDFTDAVLYIKERELLYGENALLAKFGTMVREICSNNKKYDNKLLQRSATLCLGKLMCISSKYCEENLPLFITIMERSPDPNIRSNCVLGLGDMAVCFNNLVDENTDFLYQRLTDENLMVQRTCLMTVTFLILAGQVKVKGQLSAMAKCLENPDESISDMCRLFFTELATKDNAIYNGFIDIFSGLSNDATLSKDSMKRIVRFLVGFIEKEKHQKQLADKLFVRLKKCHNEQEWNDIAFVLTTIPHKSDAINQVLESGFTVVKARETK